MAEGDDGLPTLPTRPRTLDPTRAREPAYHAALSAFVAEADRLLPHLERVAAAAPEDVARQEQLQDFEADRLIVASFLSLYGGGGGGGGAAGTAAPKDASLPAIRVTDPVAASVIPPSQRLYGLPCPALPRAQRHGVHVLAMGSSALVLALELLKVYVRAGAAIATDASLRLCLTQGRAHVPPSRGVAEAVFVLPDDALPRDALDLVAVTAATDAQVRAHVGWLRDTQPGALLLLLVPPALVREAEFYAVASHGSG